jgi:hypothetical protein
MTTIKTVVQTIGSGAADVNFGTNFPVQALSESLELSRTNLFASSAVKCNSSICCRNRRPVGSVA